MAPSSSTATTKLEMNKEDAKAKNAKMNQEREFFAKLLQAATEGRGLQIQEWVEEYVQTHVGVSKMDVLMQFRNAQKRTVLHFACQCQVSLPPEEKEDVVEVLLSPSWHASLSLSSLSKRDKDPEKLQQWVRMKDQDGLTPLMLAARYSKGVVLERRLAALLQVDSSLALMRCHSGATALHYAAAGASATRSGLMQLYQAGKVALETATIKGGCTPLHWAAGANNDDDDDDDGGGAVRTVSVLVEDCGAHVRALDEGGFSPLLLAMASRNDAVAKTLVRLGGADRSILLQGNVTLYHMAADLNLVGTLAALLEETGNPKEEALALKCCTMKNDEGWTPLQVAIKEGHVGCVLLLAPPEVEKTEAGIQAYMQERQAELSPKATPAPAPTLPTDKKTAPDKAQTAPLQDEAVVRRQVEELLEKEPPSKETQEAALALKQEGNAHVARKEWQQAMELYSQAIQLCPTDATFYSNRSACHYAREDFPNALVDGFWAKCLRPQWSKAHYRIAVARLALEEYEDAAVAAFDGLALDEENVELQRLVRKCVESGRVAHLAKQQSPSKTTTTTMTAVQDLPAATAAAAAAAAAAATAETKKESQEKKPTENETTASSTSSSSQ